jgi:tetratricopeptide (TPR) repeat protein
MKIINNILIFLFLSVAILQASEGDLLSSIDNKNSDLFIEMKTDRNQNIGVEGEDIVYYIATNKDCNLTVIRVNTEGKWDIIFPNKSHQGFQSMEGSRYEIPGFNMKKITLKGPSGTETIKAIAAVDEELFNRVTEISHSEDFTEIKSPEDFVKKLSGELNKLQKNEWATAEMEITVEGKAPTSPSVTGTPYVNPELQNIVKHDYSTEYYTQGASCYEEGKYDDAIKSFKKAIKEYPNLAYGYYSIGLSYQAKGAFKEAIEWYKKCINHGIKERDSFLRVGEIYDQLKDKKEAYLRYKKVLRLTEGFKDINQINPLDTGKENIYNLETLCSKHTDDKKSRMELAVIYEKLGNYRAGCYHLKYLLKQAIPLYSPYFIEKDKPAIEKPVIEERPVTVDYYNYYEPYREPYRPPPPPPVTESPPKFIYVDD